MSSQTARARWWSKITRSLVLFAVGLALIVKDSVQGVERPVFIAAYLVMMGLGPVLAADERRRERMQDGTE